MLQNKTLWLNIIMATIVGLNSLTGTVVPVEYIAFAIAGLNMLVRIYDLKQDHVKIELAVKKRLYGKTGDDLPPEIADAIMQLIISILKQLFESNKKEYIV